jgi:SAM-dependent methyltransferase
MKQQPAQSEEHDFLREYLAHAPVALALLRAIECRELAACALTPPVLDLGCGDGLLGQILFEARPAVGLDHSWDELRAATARGAYQALVCADIRAIPLGDHLFGTILSNGVLEHVPAVSRGLAEIARVLRPGGRLIMTVPTAACADQLCGAAILRRLGLTRLARRYADLYNRTFGQVNILTVEEWRALLAQSGLRLVHQHTYAPASVFRLHDLAMPFSIPAYLCKRVTGKWSLCAGLRRWTTAPCWEMFLRRIYLERALPGCSLLMVAERCDGGLHGHFGDPADL